MALLTDQGLGLGLRLQCTKETPAYERGPLLALLALAPLELVQLGALVALVQMRLKHMPQPALLQVTLLAQQAFPAEGPAL